MEQAADLAGNTGGPLHAGAPATDADPCLSVGVEPQHEEDNLQKRGLALLSALPPVELGWWAASRVLALQADLRHSLSSLLV